MKTTSAILYLAVAVSARTFTVKNNCANTVWPAIFTDLNVGTAVPDVVTGWEAAAGSSKSFSVPDNWKAGRIWGRSGCSFGTNSGSTSCSTGSCYGGLECNSSNGTGVPPVTLAEFTLSAPGSVPDYFDVSLVDGFNLPISVTSSAGCPSASCPVDLNPICPDELKLTDAAGDVVGCKSDCLVDPNPSNSASCCTGSHNTPSTCPARGVPNYPFFKDNCPRSYVFAYDENTAIWTCTNTSPADYTVTFCP